MDQLVSYLSLKSKKGLDIQGFVEYKTNQTLVKIIPVKHTKIPEYIQKFMPQNKIDGDKSISEFFKDFLKVDVTCEIFGKIYKDVMTDLNITNLHGRYYYLVL